MSVNGLRFGADAFSSKGPVETKTGSVIYWGDPQSFHDWEFRVLLKIQILEANEAAAAELASKLPRVRGRSVMNLKQD